MAKEAYDPEAALAEWCELREKMQWTQEEVARVLGCDQGTISKWEGHHTPIPLWALRFMRLLAQDRLPRRRKAYHHHEATFVMVQLLPTTARCWHAPQDELEVMGPNACAGIRVQFTVLLPPKPRKPHRRAQTATCEKHARDALFWLQQYYRKQRIHEDRYQRLWAYAWENSLVRQGPDDAEVEIRV